MVQEFQGKTLEEAYEKASLSLKCSITDLQIDIIQAPSKGFLGFFAKDAIIKATLYKEKKNHKKDIATSHNQEKKVETLTSKLNALRDEEKSSNSSTIQQIEKEEIFNDFYNNDKQELHKTPVLHKSEQDKIDQIKKDGPSNYY